MLPLKVWFDTVSEELAENHLHRKLSLAGSEVYLSPQILQVFIVKFNYFIVFSITQSINYAVSSFFLKIHFLEFIYKFLSNIHIIPAL